MSNVIVGEIYQDIISDVIQASRNDFEEYGVDSSVLTQLKHIWQTRLATTNVAQFPWTASFLGETMQVPSRKTETPLLSNPAMSAMRAAQQIQQLAQARQARFYGEFAQNKHLDHIPQTDGIHVEEWSSLKKEVFSKDSIPTTKQIDTSLNETLLQVYSTQKAFKVHDKESLELQQSLKTREIQESVRSFVQTDGMDSDSINSDLDSETNSNPDDLPEHDDDGQLVLCLYEKVQRTKNKWKCVLKDGIVGMGGKDYLFMRANVRKVPIRLKMVFNLFKGEFEW
ncbi:hypothetical protein T552_02797 [Pneumocystis carinii B80]|uniref:Transcription initiation factor IIA subunit 1 n=1 Tax=Pneumocystis carinii (strain B80) TaxID=1408658 RepID=A0A0W4ZDB9_PNEC8|nr:hypothetical protein T552_02797 [Pneumocystis carinii B80]KTW26311.1 hypothetical protein T552_02797 [Pneumocystis carinii B80]